MEFQLPSGQRFLLWFVREFQDDLPCGQRCYSIDWNVPGTYLRDIFEDEVEYEVENENCDADFGYGYLGRPF